MTSEVRHWAPLIYFSLPQKGKTIEFKWLLKIILYSIDSPSVFFLSKTEKNIGLVILNQSLYKSHEKFTTLWKIGKTLTGFIYRNCQFHSLKFRCFTAQEIVSFLIPAAVTICVDGGANRLYEISKEHKKFAYDFVYCITHFTLCITHFNIKQKIYYN